MPVVSLSPDVVVTVAVFEIVPGVVGETTIVMVSLAVEAIVPRLQVNRLPA